MIEKYLVVHFVKVESEILCCIHNLREVFWNKTCQIEPEYFLFDCTEIEKY